MAKHKILPKDLSAAHVRKYVGLRLINTDQGKNEHVTVAAGVLTGIADTGGPVTPPKESGTTITVLLGVNEVDFDLPDDCELTISDTMDELFPEL